MQVFFVNMPSVIEYIRAGQLRALAATTAIRAEALPDLPTVADVLPGFEASDWYGIVVARGTPGDIVDRLNKEINAALADPRMKERLAVLGGAPMPATTAEFGALMASETEKWSKVIRAANIRAE